MGTRSRGATHRFCQRSTPLLSLALLLGACRTGPSSSAIALDEAERDALVARTQGLRSFHALYDFDQGTPDDAFEECELELAYQAPDHGYVRLESDDQLFESWCTGRRILVHTRDGKEGERWRAQELPEPLGTEAGAGVVFCLTWPGLDEESGFVTWLEYRAPRSAPLDWLRFLPADPSTRLDGERIYWTGNSFRCWLEAATGLFQWLEYRTRDGFLFRLKLEERVVDEPLAPRLLEPPPESAAAEPFSG